MTLQQRNTPHPALLLPAFLCCGALLLVWARLAGGAVWDCLVFMQGADQHMDFFNCMVEAANLHVYEASGSIYPPLANLVYYALGKIVPPGTSASALRASTAGTLLYWVFTWAVLAALALLAAQAVRGAWYRRLTAGILCLTTAPVVYAVNRGNLVLLAVVFSFVFLLWYHSENALLREVAIISLALSANLKIYPALLGLLLLCDKRHKSAVRCALYASILFFVPFLFMGGRSGLLALFTSLSFTSGKFAVTGFGYKIDFGNIVAILAGLCGNTAPLWQTTGMWLGWTIFAGGVCALPFVRSRWRRAALLCACIAGVPGFSYQYNLCYILPAAALFFAQEYPMGAASPDSTPQRLTRPKSCFTRARTTACLVWYALLLAGCLVPLPFAPARALTLLSGVYDVSTTVLCSSVSLLLLAVTLTIHGLMDAWRAAGEKRFPLSIRRVIRGSILALPSAALLCLCMGTANNVRAFTAFYEAQTLAPVRKVLAMTNTQPDCAVLSVPHSSMAYRALGVPPDENAPSIPASAQFNISYYLYAPLQAALQAEKLLLLSPELYRHWQLAVQAEQGDGFASMFAVATTVDGTALLRRAPETALHTLLLAAQGDQIWLVNIREDGSVNLAGFSKTREWQGVPPEDPDAFFAKAAATGDDIIVSKAFLKKDVPDGYQIVLEKGSFALLRQTQ